MIRGPRYHLVDTEDGRSIQLCKGKVKLVHRDDPRATVFNVRQAMRWMKHHPKRRCAAVAIEQEVAA